MKVFRLILFISLREKWSGRVGARGGHKTRKPCLRNFRMRMTKAKKKNERKKFGVIRFTVLFSVKDINYVLLVVV